MIGQKKLYEKISSLISNGFPRFVIITGMKGQGKKYIAANIANKLNYELVVLDDVKIDTIRTTIQLAYKQTEPIIYLIPDADKMSIGAKNSLLKVIEEPPNNAYFIMTLQTLDNTLKTIQSRAYELKMDNYTEEELTQFINLIDSNTSANERCILLNCCTNLYELKQLYKYGILEFYDYVNKVVNNIYKVQSANSFKLTEKLQLKPEEDKYDLKLFLQTYKSICMNNLIELLENNAEESIEFSNYADSILITSQVLEKLFITGINKQSLIDIWILNIRKIWKEL